MVTGTKTKEAVLKLKLNQTLAKLINGYTRSNDFDWNVYSRNEERNYLRIIIRKKLIYLKFAFDIFINYPLKSIE